MKKRNTNNLFHFRFFQGFSNSKRNLAFKYFLDIIFAVIYKKKTVQYTTETYMQ